MHATIRGGMQVVAKAEAKARGLKRYFTGELCNAGLHRDERYACNGQCVPCNRERNLAKYQNNAAFRERFKAYCRKRHHAKRDELNAQTRARYYANHEARKAKERARHALNRERFNQGAKARYRADPEAYKARNRKARAADPEKYRKLDRAKWHRYHARKQAAEGSFFSAGR